MDKWEDVVLYDWTHHSGESGERFYHVRRVRAVPSSFKAGGMQLQGLMRVEWFNPDTDGTEFEWEYMGVI